jgi:hypothetical protein
MHTRLLNCLLLIAFAGIGVGCSDGLYSATATNDGNVIVVNRVTGEARSIRGDTAVDVRSPTSSPTSLHKPVLAAAAIPNQPLSVKGIAKYRDQNMLVRISIEPNKAAMSDDEWTAWRLHIFELKSTARLDLQFLDEDGFVVISEPLSLDSMTQRVDGKGNLDAMEEQVSIAMSPKAYEAVSAWTVGWSGFWPTYTPPANTASKAGKL